MTDESDALPNPFRLSRWTDIGLALLAGVLMASGQGLSLPGEAAAELGRGGWLDPLGLIGLVPLLIRIRDLSPRRALWLGWLAGLAHFFVSLWWITQPMVTFTPIPLVGAVPILGLLVAFLALFWALPVWLARRFEQRLGVGLVWSLPVLWIAFLWLRTWVLTGFPWAAVGYTQVRSMWLAQLASIGGIYLVTGAVVFSNTVATHLLVRLRARRRPEMSAVLVWLGLMVLAGVWAAVRLGSEPAPADAPRLTASVVQGNLDERAHLRGWGDQLWVAKRMLAESNSATSQGAKLVVWPEGSLPMPLPGDAENLARELGSPPALAATLVTGGIGYGRDQGRLVKTNSAFVTDGSLRVVGRYDKAHLVPYGEYVLLGAVLPWEWFVPEGTTFFTPGQSHAPVRTDAAALGMLICYEAIFPGIARQSTAEGAELLVNITNDAWFGPSAAPYQHLIMSRMRSIETDRYQLRAANTGVSAVIDPRGRELARLPIGLARTDKRSLRRAQLPPPAHLTAQLARLQTTTPYVLVGHWLPWACALATLAGIGLAWWRRRRSTAPVSD